MESEARNEINNDYNKFFYATMCHVCKWFGDGVQLESCRGCKMISYCGQEHQKQHWKEHKSLCEAIQDVLGDDSMDYCGETTDEWALKKMIFMKVVSYRLRRYLNADELGMFFFPKECLICHKWKLLESCQKCAVSFCQIHKNHIDHWDICAPLELCLRTNLFFSTGEGYELPDSVLQNNFCLSTFHNMRDFIKAFANIQTHSEMLYNVLAAKHSEYLTRPLTLFYAMRLLNYVPKRKDLVIHVVGATYFEEATILPWQVLLQLIETVISVVVIMIGPELKDKVDPSRTCNNCLLFENKSLFFEYHDVSYENYVRSPSFVKPDLVVGFNLVIREHELGSSEEIWAPSIHALAEQNCLFVLTFFTRQDFEKGTNKMNTILGKEVDHLYDLFSGKNPFASCRPHRDFGPERVYYHNQYIIIYQSRCS